MADRILTQRLCDFCQADEIETPDAQRFTLFGFEVDACKTHGDPLEALRATVEQLGRKIPKSSTASAAVVSTSDGGRLPCPACGKLLKNRGSLGAHATQQHGVSLGMLERGETRPVEEHPCHCGRVFPTAAGLRMHRFRSHNETGNAE